MQDNTISIPGLGTITFRLGDNPGFRFEAESPTRIRLLASEMTDQPIVLMCARMDVGCMDTDNGAPVLVSFVSKDTAAQRARMLSEVSGVGAPGLGEHAVRMVDGKVVAIDRTGEWRAVFTDMEALSDWGKAHGVSWT